MADTDLSIRSGGQASLNVSGGKLIAFGNDANHTRPKYLLVQGHPDNTTYIAIGASGASNVVSSATPGSAKGLQLQPGQIEALPDIFFNGFYAHAQNATDALVWLYQV